MFGILLVAIGVMFSTLASGDDAAQPQLPNILWITAEDMSPTLGCYSDAYAQTPNLDAFARQSTRYSHAFATAPVCSPSRSCLIHGCAATTTGTHSMRSLMPLPENMQGLPALLREHGYYTSNNVKTDYNTADEPEIVRSSWDDSSPTAHWRNRKPDQPFFCVMNLMTTHQSRTMVWPYQQFQDEIQSQLAQDEIHSPADVPLPPYYPDTPVVRKTMARYYDCVTVMDKQVGDLLRQLSDDGLVENTIVLFYSDHGSGMPRHKRALFDSGMRVPLMIRVPQSFAKWAPTAPGHWSDRLVCFSDFAPTVLSLAGIKELPSYVRGRPFLGALATEPRQFVYGHRDRVDEILDTARSVRSRRYLYIRNFIPHRGWNQQNAWCDQGAIRADFYALAKSGKATRAQAQYLNPTRPVEELYDCEADPLNLVNLAGKPENDQRLRQMRSHLFDHLRQSSDLGFVPEIELAKIASERPPMDWVASGDYQIGSCLEAASLVGSTRWPEIESALTDQNVSVRYWGAVACTAADSLSDQLIGFLKGRLTDPSVAVRIEAAGALAHHGKTELGFDVLRDIVSSSNRSETEILYAARTIEMLADPSQRDVMQRLYDRFEHAPGDMAWFIRFSTTGYLSRLPAQEP